MSQPSASKSDPRYTCDTCGRWTGMDTHICGTCAEDWNDRDVAAGTARINRRRERNGLEPIERDQ